MTLLRKILTLHTNISIEIDFLPIFYPVFQDLCHFIQLSKITPFFYNNFFLFRGYVTLRPLLAPMGVAEPVVKEMQLQEEVIKKRPSVHTLSSRRLSYAGIKSGEVVILLLMNIQ